MAPPPASGRDERPARGWYIVAALLVTLGVVISGMRLATPYSYWLDELFSVSVSGLDWPGLYHRLLLDVHPPLYQIVLKLWMGVVGSAEPATRSLSWLCALAALGTAVRFAARRGTPVFAIAVAVLLATNGTLAFYANETRAYGMTLWLATAMAVRYPSAAEEAVRPGFFIAALLLALTHYFGLILAGLTLLGLLVQRRAEPRTRWWILGTAACCLLWPLQHLTAGALLAKTGGNFWITVAGPIDSLRRAAATVVVGVDGWAPLVLVVGMVGSALLWAPRRHVEGRAGAGAVARLGAWSALMVMGLVGLVAVIDRFTPMSTTRNYIVIVPLVVFALAAAADAVVAYLPRFRTLVLLVIMAYGLAAARAGFYRVRLKAEARQDWKSAIAQAAAQRGSRSIFFYTGGALGDHYFRAHGIPTKAVWRYVPGESSLDVGTILVYGNLSDEQYAALREAMVSRKARHLFPAEDRRFRGHAGLFVIE